MVVVFLGILKAVRYAVLLLIDRSRTINVTLSETCNIRRQILRF